MRPFDLIGHWFWVACLAINVVNYRRASGLARQKFAADPQHAATAERLLRRFAALAAVPWLVMGAGVLFGGVPGVWNYFRPQDGDPFVIAWIASAFLLSVAFAVWVFAFDGATKMVDSCATAIFGGRGAPTTPRGVRWMAAIGPFFTLLWVWLVVTMNAPLPH